MDNFESGDCKGSQQKNIEGVPISMSDLVPNIGSYIYPADDVRRPDGPPLPRLVIKQGSMGNYDGDPNHESATQKTVVTEAVKDLGKELWHNWTPGHVPGGGADAEEGCAASVSQVLNDCGAASLNRPEDDNCDYMQQDLQAQGWTLTNRPQPGDVWIGRGGESEAHTGIIGENYKLMDNHSSNGLWSTDDAGYTYAWRNSVFLQPPDQK